MSTQNLLNVHVIWVVDGPGMVTLLQYEDTVENRRLLETWTEDQFVSQAKDTEEISQESSYELIAIITGDIKFIY